MMPEGGRSEPSTLIGIGSGLWVGAIRTSENSVRAKFAEFIFHALFVNKEGKGPQGLARLSGIGSSCGRSRSRGHIWGRSRDGLLNSRLDSGLDGLLNRHGTRRRRTRGGL